MSDCADRTVQCEGVYGDGVGGRKGVGSNEALDCALSIISAVPEAPFSYPTCMLR